MKNDMHGKVEPRRTHVGLLPVLGVCVVFLNVATNTSGQTAGAKQSPRSKVAPSSAWIEDKVSVRKESPYISDKGNIVLVYTVTNKSGADITLEFTRKPDFSLKPQEPTRVFFKLREPPSYSQVTPDEDLVDLDPSLLPAHLPVVFHIVVRVPTDDKPSWFSSETVDERLRKILTKALGNVDSIAVFIPDRHLKISFPVPRRPR